MFSLIHMSCREFYRVTTSAKKNSPGRNQWLAFMRLQLESLDIQRYSAFVYVAKPNPLHRTGKEQSSAVRDLCRTARRCFPKTWSASESKQIAEYSFIEMHKTYMEAFRRKRRGIGLILGITNKTKRKSRQREHGAATSSDESDDTHHTSRSKRKKQKRSK
jgi:hypothetical protein